MTEQVYKLGKRVKVNVGHGSQKRAVVRDIRIMPKGGKAYQVEFAGGLKHWFAENEITSVNH